MGYMYRFSVGFVAAFFDEFGTIAARDRMMALVGKNGDSFDGFDCAYNIIIYPLFWRRGRS